jgi:hypothetical protein
MAEIRIEAGQLDAARALLDALEHKARDASRHKALQARLKLVAAGGGADAAALQARIAANGDDPDARLQLANALALSGDYRPALEHLLAIVRRDRKWQDEAARKAMLDLFTLLGGDGVRPQQVAAAVQLLDEGATVPFIARYRKEVTDNLDDTSCAISKSAWATCASWKTVARPSCPRSRTGQADAGTAAAIENADTKQRLEDLYLPYKQKRRTKAQIAREAGAEPLADALFADPDAEPGSRGGEVHADTQTEPPRSTCPTSRRRSTARARS